MVRPLALLSLAAGVLAAGRDMAVFPIGTTVSIRFRQPLRGGRDGVGTRVVVQTMNELSDDGCAVVPPYARAVGRVTLSRGGRWFGGRGALAVRFDSLEVRPAAWIAIDAVLDGLEYARDRDLTHTGVVYGSRASVAGRALPVGIAGAVGLDAGPLAVLGGYWLARRGPAARITPGQMGTLRLTAPLSVAGESLCRSVTAPRPPAVVPELPAIPARSAGRGGKVPADPINLVFIGSAADLDSAFRRAGWVAPRHASFGTVSREIVAGLVNRPAVGAPLSRQFLDGRRQDVAYELSGPNARLRHHVRIWLQDTLAPVWVGAANHDVGVMLNPFKGRFTHRISPAIDEERDRIVRELEATGCGELLDYVDVAGAVREGRNATGQRFVTDGRAAVILLRACAGSAGNLVDEPE